MSALADQFAFHLRQRGQDVKEEPAGGGCRIDPFRDRAEVGAALAQTLYKIDQGAHGAPKAIEPPHDKAIAFPHVRQRFGEPWPVIASAACWRGSNSSPSATASPWHSFSATATPG